MNEKMLIFVRGTTTFLMILILLFYFVELNRRNQPLLCGDNMAVHFEHEYSDLRRKETPLYQNIQLDYSSMVIIFRNLSLDRNYLLVQLGTYYLIDKTEDAELSNFWFEFNETTGETIWLEHNNKEFYLCVWFESDMCRTQGWDWIIRFGVIDD